MQKIRDSISRKSSKDLEISAHTLKGAVSNFYSAKCHSIALEMEVKAKKSDLSGVEKLLEELECEMKILITFLEKLKAELL